MLPATDTVRTATALGHAFGAHLDLSASVYNLLDKKYFNPGRPEDVEEAIQQDGRTFRVKLTAHSESGLLSALA